MKLMQGEDVVIDIYGDGPLKKELQEAIDESGVRIRLLGQVNNISEVLKKYDAFVMPSFYEGFSLSVLEAMAMKIPLLLSDIPSFREQCEDTALFFNLGSPTDLAQKIRLVKSSPSLLSEMSDRAYQRVLHNFTLPMHVEKLRKIYSEELGRNQNQNKN